LIDEAGTVLLPHEFRNTLRLQKREHARELVVDSSWRKLLLISQECRKTQQVNALDVLKVRLVT
jgi:hypothetical protein